MRFVLTNGLFWWNHFLTGYDNTGNKVLELEINTQVEKRESETSLAVMGDILDFLNEKYIDKNINEEWGRVDVDARIKYHEEQIKILKSGNGHWNRHGNGVEGD